MQARSFYPSISASSRIALASALAMVVSGCGTQTIGASSSGRVPKMPPGANLPRWEHVCMAAAFGSNYTDFVNEAGDEGWELVAMSNGALCFKRPKVAPPADAAKPAPPLAAAKPPP